MKLMTTEHLGLWQRAARGYSACLLVVATGMAAAQTQTNVKVEDAWVRLPVAAQRDAGAFMQITSAQDLSLVEVRSVAARVTELHEMVVADNIMKMRAVPALDLPKGKLVELRPGSYHVMLIDLAKPLRAGDKVTITLIFEGRDKKRTAMDVMAEVRPMLHGAHPHADADAGKMR
jgi:copper(I)-binding protein